MALLRRIPRFIRIYSSHRCCSSTASPPSSLSPARTRFAPSPTGFLHLGSLRTALFNYLLAKSTGGQFLLRIEDTDKKRTVEGAEQNIFDTLRWAGLQWDEGPEVGGPYGPYRQSERADLHRSHAEQLIASNHAYRCFCAPERLSALAVARKRSGLATDYDRTCISIDPSESESRAAAGEKYVVRLKVPDQYPSFTDEVYGPITFAENSRAHSLGAFEDPVLLKSDGLPTYHLANVVDDHYMRITHVLRATEWLPSAPKHMHLYNCFGWEAPKFAHVGLLQDQRRNKLSKRNNDVYVGQYREKGYLPEAVNNFVALLGWSHNAGNDVMGIKELVERFRTDRLTSGNTVVNFEKLDFLQKQHARERLERGGEEGEEIFRSVEKEVRKQYGSRFENGEPITPKYIHALLHANINAYCLPETFVASSAPLFAAPPSTDTKEAQKIVRQIKKYLTEEKVAYEELMDETITAFRELEGNQWNVETLQEISNRGQEDRPRWTAKMRTLRLALMAGVPGPGVAVTMELLGKQRAMGRIESAKGVVGV